MKKIVTVFMFLASVVVGDVIKQTHSIDEEIAAIQKASPQERVDLMNALKRKLMQMNKEDRMATISKMRAHMSSQQHAGNSYKHQSSYGEGIGKRVTNMQTDNLQNVTHQQNMVQKQAVNQYKQQNHGKMATPKSRF